MSKKTDSRRDFMKWFGITGGYMTLAPYVTWAQKTNRSLNPKTASTDFLKKQGPIDYQISLQEGNSFLGDQPQMKAHPILWDKESFLKKNKFPTIQEEAELVIIGGGLSGLSSAYLLRDFHPIVLEQSPRFGGNSKAEVWNDISYSLGAAYFMEQEPQTELYKLFAELGIHSLCRERKDEDLKLLDGRLYEKFWTGETDLTHRTQFIQLTEFFKQILKETNGKIYPEIPLSVSDFSDSTKKIKYLKSLDKYNFKDYLEKVVLSNAKLVPHIEQALERYFWSAFGCSINEISAAMGLNAYAAEFGKAYVAPGGNAKVAEQILKKALDKVPEKNFRTDSLVIDVRVEKERVLVTYSDSLGQLKTIKAKSVIMACPKFVVKKILNDIEPDRMQAFNKLNYRSYLVANALIKKETPKDIYDFYLIGKNLKPEESMVSDTILANYAHKKISQSTVLTLYRALPFDSGRKLIYEEDSFSKYKKEIQDQLEQEIFPVFKFRKEDLHSLRISRWGHPLPLPSVGFIADGTIEKIRKPFKKRIFFIEQDNWMMASLETSVIEALHWTKEVRHLLQKSL